jgi:hypothetical protein
MQIFSAFFTRWMKMRIPQKLYGAYVGLDYYKEKRPKTDIDELFCSKLVM